MEPMDELLRHNKRRTHDGHRLEVKGCVLRMTAFIEDRFVGLLAGKNGYKRIRFVVLAKVTTYAALTVMNCLHRRPPCFLSYDSAKELAVVFDNEGASEKNPRKSRLKWSYPKEDEGYWGIRGLMSSRDDLSEKWVGAGCRMCDADKEETESDDR